jgi:hypothetical protein
LGRKVLRDYLTLRFLRRPSILPLIAWLLAGCAGPGPLRLEWERNMLSIRRPDLPGGKVEVWYMEAFCRSGSIGGGGGPRDPSPVVAGEREGLGLPRRGQRLKGG